MSHIANDLLGTPERERLYKNGGRLDPDEIEAGMFVIGPGPAYSIYPVVARCREGERLPREHGYSRELASGGWSSGRWTKRDCVCLAMRGAPRGPARVARVYRDVTSEVYERL